MSNTRKDTVVDVAMYKHGARLFTVVVTTLVVAPNSGESPMPRLSSTRFYTQEGAEDFADSMKERGTIEVSTEVQTTH